MPIQRRSKADTRKRDLALIHMAKAQLALDDETYRAMLWTVARVDSAARLDHAGRQQVLDHLKARGFAVRAKRKRPDVEAMLAPQIAKIEALLAERGAGWEYAEAILRRMHGVRTLRWATPEQLRHLIAALETDARRHAARSPEPGAR